MSYFVSSASVTDRELLLAIFHLGPTYIHPHQLILNQLPNLPNSASRTSLSRGTSMEMQKPNLSHKFFERDTAVFHSGHADLWLKVVTLSIG